MMESLSDSESPWQQTNEYSWSHPSGWTITRYLVKGAKTYLLWDRTGQPHGPFPSAKDAQAEFDRQPKADDAPNEPTIGPGTQD
jgi:hypothetical protein